jgi:hypothetical protein
MSATGLETSGFKDLPEVDEVVEFVNGTEGLASASSPTAVVDVTSPTIGVLTTTGSNSEVGAAESVEAIEVWIVDQRSDAAAPVRQVVADQREDAVARLADLDGEIAGLQGRDALRDAYLAERSDLNVELLRLDRQDRALDSFSTMGDNLVVLDSDTATSNTRVIWFVIGAFLGALVAVIVVVARAHSDRRVRTRTEMSALTGAPTLPLIPTSGPERDVALAAFAAAMERLTGAGPVQMVPADEQRAVAVVRGLPTADGYSPSSVSAAHEPGSRAIVVAAAGRTHADDVVRTCEYLHAFGCDVVGAVLGDVPERELRRSMA